VSGNAVRWLGHSTVVIRLDGQGVLTDPVVRERVMHLRRRVAVDDDALHGLDAVIVSHIHYDHLDLPSLDRIDRALPIVVPQNAGGLVKRRGFRDVREVQAGDELELGRLRIHVTHAEHAPCRRPGTGRTPALGYALEGTRSVYFAGDTDLFAEMSGLGPVDAALLPVAGWGPRLPAGHLDPHRAAEAVLLLQARIAIPIHWGTYAPWRPPLEDPAPARAFAEAVSESAPGTEVRVLRPGETCRID